MLRLAPEWSLYYDEFWETIRRRNTHFIKLRFLAIFCLLILNLYADMLLNLHLTEFQNTVIEIVLFSMLIYNITFIYLKKLTKNKTKTFNPLYISFLQIILDLISLLTLIHFTGSIESPLIWFATFHMIVGSIILPELIIYVLSGIYLLFFYFITFGEYYEILPHYHVKGFMEFHLHTNFQYVGIINFTISVLLIFTVYLTNRIAKELYTQQGNLLIAMDEIKKTEEKKHKYLLGVVHEIKSPIVATHSLIQLIIKGYLGKVNEKIMEKLLRIEVRNTEVIEMINSILRISRMHKLEEEQLKEFDFNEMLRKTIDRFLDFSESKGITINFENNLQRKILAEEELIGLVFSNLISNAIKYTESGGLIKIETAIENQFAIISICDNGIGIEGEDKNKIFEPYYRCKPKDKTEGLGIGLYLVKEIINQHKGTISVESPSPIGKEGRPGTCFRISLPINPTKIQNNQKLNEKIRNMRS